MIKSIHELELSDFDLNPIWKTAEMDVEVYDEFVEPINVGREKMLSEEDYWVRLKGVLNDSTNLFGIGQFNMQTDDIFSISFKLNDEWEVLHLPPAPDFVLEATGPIPFSAKLNKDIKSVFPMKIEVDVSVDILPKTPIKRINI